MLVVGKLGPWSKKIVSKIDEVARDKGDVGKKLRDMFSRGRVDPRKIYD